MSVDLTPLRHCFEGIIPSIVATVALDGTPNISYLSHVHLVDSAHVALSNQFFSKTAANIAETGRATLMVVDGRTGVQHVLDLVHVDEHKSGPLFDRMAAHVRILSAQHGMADIMALRSADVYRVEAVTPVPAAAVRQDAGPVRPSPGERLNALADLLSRLAHERDLDRIIDLALGGLDQQFGYRNTMLLVGSAASGRLATLASHGYLTSGVGSEIAFGEGVIGIAAEARLTMRIGDASRGRRYAAAIRAGLETEERSIPWPGLDKAVSQIAVPLLRAGAVHGILFAESHERLAFTAEDEDVLTIVAAQLAAHFAAMLQATEEERDAGAPLSTAPSMSLPAREIAVRHFSYDDSVFIDGDYLIKGVSGRLLIHMLRRFADTGQRDFTNRELRLAPDLRLPDVRDNLETRLILLRRRLEERGAPVRLLRPERGRLRLHLDGRPVLTVERG